MSRPRILDLFCGAGGASVGYARAGFEVVGVDVALQPRYPFEFVQADALSILRGMRDYPTFSGEMWRPGYFAAIHASPPCQGYSAMSNCRPGLADTYERLIDAVRGMLVEIGVPWVIENVEGSGLAGQGDLFGAHRVLLCGAMFGAETYRHRLFESSMPLVAPVHPRHAVPTSDAGHWKPGTYISVAGNCAPIAIARRAMGIDWMNRDELAESIPPAYTEFLGAQLLAHLAVAA